MTDLDYTLFLLIAVMGAAIVYLTAVNRSQRRQLAERPRPPAEAAGNGEVEALRERVRVLERSTVDKEHSRARPEVADLRERVRRLEAIASGAEL